MEHAQNTKQQMVMLQFNFAKDFDSIKRDFIHDVLAKMGFGDKISNIIYLLAKNYESCNIINGRLTDFIDIKRSVKQGCTLNPLKFDLATHPLFCMLEQLAKSGELHGLKIQHKNMLGLEFADDTFLFLKACNINVATHPLFCMLEQLAKSGELHGLKIQHKNMLDLEFAYDTFLFLKACNINVANYLTLLQMYSDVDRLYLNISKSTLIILSAESFESLVLHGIFMYLG